MDNKMKKKRKPDAKARRKVLLSIVDPWDVKVASVDPVNLASRRNVTPIETFNIGNNTTSTTTATTTATGGMSSPLSPTYSSPGCSSISSAGRTTPWPWYKPSTQVASSISRSSSSSSASPAAAVAAPEEKNVALVSTDVPIKLSSQQSKDTTTDSSGQLLQLQTSGNSQTDRVDFHSDTNTSDCDRVDFGGENNVENTKSDRSEKAHVAGEADAAGVAATSANRPDRISDKSLVALVEQLVRSRYNSTPIIQRKVVKKRPLLQINSFNHTDKDDNVELLNNKLKKIVINAKATEQKLSSSAPPKLDDMDRLQMNNEKSISSKFTRRESDSSATFSNSGSTLNGSTLGSETEDEGNDEESSKIPLQSSQRQGGNISSSRNLANDHMDYPNVQSTNSTITSVNSISSLLKEKLQWSIPQALRSNKKRQNADYRLRGFVGFLFLCIVFMVGFAHVYYNQHVLQRAYFKNFRFNKNERQMHVYNSLGVEVLGARLGVDIPRDSGVFSCLAQHQRPGKFCLEWLGHSRLYLGHTQQREAAINCYHVTWQSLAPGVQPRDCIDWSARRGHWYGAGQIQSMGYPLEQGRLLEPSPFITGDVRKHPFGNVLKRYFLNSKGAAVSVDPESPLYVSINSSSGRKELCLQARHDGFAYINHLTEEPQLNYSICASDSMRNLHASMAEKLLWDGLKPDELQAVHSLLSEPVWQIAPSSEADVYNYTEDVIALGFLRQGHVLLSEEWQPSPGDLVLDEARFRSMKDTIDVIHRRGFRIVFTVQPFISTESENFRDALAGRLLVSERGSDPRIPALTRYRHCDSAAVLDITNNRSLPWLQAKLESLVDRYHVDAFYLDLGTAQDMPHYYKCEQPLTNPDHYKTLFVNSILGSVPVIGVSSAIARPRAPVFVSLPPFPSSWKAIKTVIPTVLSYGIIGYPFIMPGAVGGDVALPMSDDNPDNDFQVSLPDKELYIRWLQLSTFLPVIRFTHLPSKYSDENVLEIAKTLTTLRQKTVTPLLKKYANITLDTGLPIIRPLWMLDPADPACHIVVDEFSVGEELIVAPILHSGSRQREVYLPAGVWKDGIDKSLRKGSRWIHNYRVAEDKVAYFVKMPDDMRF